MTEAAELVQRLEEGVRQVMSSEGWRRFLQAQAKFHQYSAGNVLLILSQRPGASLVAGFNAWRDLGRHVRKGEHSIAILAPVFPRKEKQPDAVAGATADANAKHRESDEDRPSPVRFRVAHVFDIAQTEGAPVPAPPVHELRGQSEQAWWLIDQLTKLASAEHLRVSYAPPERMHGAKGYYQPDTQAIVLRDDMSRDQRAKTLAHELAHHILQHGRGREPGRPTEEAEAEGVAFVVCSRFGLDTSDYSFGYVANWSRDEGGPTLVKQASAAIQAVAGAMIDRIETERSHVPTGYRSEAAMLER